MEGTEVRKLAQLEDKHWWYAERRHLLAKAIQGLTPGRALDIGAAGGGNTRVLVEHGWSASPLEYGEDGAEVAHERGLPVMRADAMRLPLQDESLDLVVAFDVLEHLEDDDASAREVLRVLRRGGSFLIAVPADPRLWSAHDEAVGHVRRYTRESLLDLLRRNGFEIDRVASWMVLLRPAVAIKRRSSSGSDLDDPPRIVNAALRGVVTLERYLPVKRLPGVSLVVRARRP
ncbi:methyltransferase domain-containing protein [Luteipulveratus sp. YIM 133132]|uniref:class I SAM-dependent methyltransferase n=1 Tax=Luteipulveratus flavus TaxID=3031728 RepID=UPI0023B15F9E|nr:class I SAM-dependent methyltransferase [Luteipulveratus sp. YIM 133132]MDE9367609.1 methyltransferase domain-containing protein [Luteipulveratus sp. YIM 133132]